MILLDTHVVSEPLRALPDPKVLDWLDAQAIETLYLSSITVAELRFGIAVLPEGKRRDTLLSSLEQRVLPLFAGRILGFDLAAAQSYAALRAHARASWQAIATADGYIAAIAAAKGFAIATRDSSPFEAAGLSVINPWDFKAR